MRQKSKALLFFIMVVIGGFVGNVFNESQKVQAGPYCEKDHCETYACGFLWLQTCGSCQPNGDHTTNCNATGQDKCATLGCKN